LLEGAIKRLRDFGIVIGTMETGARNAITDVPGVRVGHATVDSPGHKTGVTVILPSEDNIFINKMTAASYVLNGFGKTMGLIQIDELGSLESPIALTNTLNVGIVHDALVGIMVERCATDGIQLRSINPVVGECNDAELNNIGERAVASVHVADAIANAGLEFDEGDVGAGRGTVCYGLKGGIGSASRIIALKSAEYTMGVLVQSNHGRLEDLLVDGRPYGELILAAIAAKDKDAPPAPTPSVDSGSIIIIVATDLPISDRQLKRVLKRATVGLARTGSYIGHGSGEIVIGFTSANRHLAGADAEYRTLTILAEEALDKAFRAVAEATEEAILNSMACAQATTRRNGQALHSLAEFLA
jgi:D-aminopeptidase